MLIQEIEKSMGISGLKEAWDKEEIVELEPTKIKHFTEAEHRQLITNIQNDIPSEKWEEAKRAGEEMPIKELKRELGLEFEGKTAKALYDHMAKQIDLSKETSSDKIKSEYEKDIIALRETLDKERKKYIELESSIKKSTIDNYIKSLVNKDEISIPNHIKEEPEIKKYVEIERQKNELLFKSLHKFELDDYNNIVTTDTNGNVIKDDTQSPLKVDNIYQDFKVNNFMNLKKVENKGRGEGDRFPSRDMTNFNNVQELMTYYEAKGVKTGTSEMDAIVLEYNKKK